MRVPVLVFAALAAIVPMPAAAMPCAGDAAGCDAAQDEATPCRTRGDCDDGNPCTDDACSGGLCSSTANDAGCDDGLWCTVDDRCTEGECTGSPRECGVSVAACEGAICDEDEKTCRPLLDDLACDDGDDCTDDVCVPGAGCEHAALCEAGAPAVCRSARFWAAPAAAGGGWGARPTNIAQELIDATGPLEVCGRVLAGSSRGAVRAGSSADPVIEALCVRPERSPQRRLMRELVVAALNCAASGAAGNCDAVVSQAATVSFDACDRLCAGTSQADFPSASDCIRELACFNEGGTIDGGICSFGRCEKQPEIACGGAAGDCPDYGDLPQRCVERETSCAENAICNDAIGFCPREAGASGAGACKAARQSL